MHRQRFLLAAFLAAFILASGAMDPPYRAAAATAQGAAGAQKTSSTTINLTTTVYDFDAAGVPFLMRSDDFNSTGQATYTTINGSGNTPALFSGIESIGDWKLNLYNQSVRTLWLTPNDAVDGAQPAGPPAGYYWQNVEAYCQCFDQSGNLVPFPNLTNGSNNCSLGVDFNSNGTKYKLVMSPRLPAGAPATGLASVVCNAVSNGQCVNWTITPNTAAANATVADLFYFSKRGALVFVGQYHNTFRITVSNP